MPCTDGGPSYPIVNVQEMKAKLDKVTRLLCNLLKEIPESAPMELFSDCDELKEWKKQHDLLDALKEQAEKAAADLQKKKDEAEFKHLEAKYFNMKEKLGK